MVSDYMLALEARDTIRRLVAEEIERQRPRYRLATVVSIDRVNRKCTVTFSGNTSNAVVNMGSIQPASVGQVVRVAGLAGDRYIDDVLGDAYNFAIATALSEQNFKYTDDTSTTYSSTTAATMGARGGQGTFEAPPSGRILLLWSGRLNSSADGQYSAIGFEIREGTTVGSGTVFYPYSTDDSLLNFNSYRIQCGDHRLIEGLTPGADYNVRNMMASGAGTGGFEQGQITIVPMASTLIEPA